MTQQAYISNTELLAQLPVFYQPWYLDIFGLDWNVLVLENEAAILVCPYLIEKKFTVNLLRAPELTPYYGGFVVKKNEDEAEQKISELWQQLFQQLPKGFHALQAHFSQDAKVFLDLGYQPKPRVTHILGLQASQEDLLKNMDYMRRKNINKAAKELVLKQNSFDVDVYFNWMQATYEKRGQKFTSSLSFLKKYVDTVIQNNAAVFNTYETTDGIPVAMSLCLMDKDYGYSILGANNPEIKHSAATTALLWQAILAAKNRSCKYFDFEGSSIPAIADFFKKFGSETIHYNAYFYTHSLLWKWKQKILK